MMGAPEPRDEIRKAIAEGTAAVDRARQNYRLQATTDEDGPRMRAWKRGERSAGPVELPAGYEPVAGMLAHIVAFEAAGRWIAAAAGLARLREHYDTFRPAELPADEQTWPAFVAKHLPFGLGRTNQLIGRMVHRGGLLLCTRCGTQARCACICGVPYVPERRAMTADPADAPTAIERATAAIAANPTKSNRAIAAEIGVSFETVRRARAAAKAAAANVSRDVS
jgi:hypothetical protein